MDEDPYELNEPDPEYNRTPDADAYSGHRTPPPQQQPVYSAPQPVGRPHFAQVSCTMCGYNLTGVSIGGNCPECGAGVDASLYASGQTAANGFAITSMVLGIISVLAACCCPAGFLGVIGLVFGIISMQQIGSGQYSGASKGMAITGIICSSVAIFIALGWSLLALVGSF